MSDLRSKAAQRMPKVSAQGLKLFSAVVVLLVNAGAILLEQGLIRVDAYTQEELLAAMDASDRLNTLVGAASILQLLAGLAVPIFALLLVEGFLHTGSYPRYLGAVAITAVVSEFAYDFALTGKALEFSRQNPMLALTVCLVMLYALRMPETLAAVEKGICQILITLAAFFWAVLIRADCGTELVLLTAIFYCFRHHPTAKLLLGVLASVAEPLGPMAFCGICCYSGKRELKIPKYVFYALYPAQLLIFGVIARCFLR